MPADNSPGLLTPRGLQRRIKRHFIKAEHTFLATVTPGFENILESEVRSFKECTRISRLKGGVEFSGPAELVYKTNLHLRTANRVLLRIASFTARSYPEAYNKLKRIRWELYLGFSETFAVHCTSRNSRLHHTANIQNTVAEAVSSTMAKLGVKTSMSDDTDLKLHVRFADDVCTVSIDSSGDYLFKRGYRKSTALAPIRETTAAALLLAAGWESYPTIVDPMCGSGVFATEAALMSLGRAPGLTRGGFAFQLWPSFNRERWEKIRNEAQKMCGSKSGIMIFASDLNDDAVNAAKNNALKACVNNFMTIGHADALNLRPPGTAPGLLVSNLPYGKRVGEGNIAGLVSRFGSHLKSFFQGWNFAFVTSERNFSRLSGLSADSVLSFKNGGIQVFFFIGKVHGTNLCSTKM